MTTKTKLTVPADIEETPLLTTDMTKTTQPTENKHQETIQLTKKLQLTDATGKVIYDTGETPCNSFVIAFILGLWACFTTTDQTATDIYESWHRIVNWRSPRTQLFQIEAKHGETRFGPVVGMGTKPLSNFDTRLDNQIQHGLASAQLRYGETTLLSPTEVTGALVITIHRTFTNQGATPITVHECGIYSANGSGFTPRFHCFIRDLVSPAVNVPVGHSLLLEYKILTRV